MAKSRKQVELSRLVNTPHITFEKGMMDTDMDASLGYVQLLNNTEIENGSVVARDGTRRMNNSDVNLKFLKSYNISGVEVLFGIDQNNFLRAWLESYPEIDMYVCRQGFDRQKDYLSNVTYDGDGLCVRYPSGHKFISDEDDRYIYIISDSAKVIRIDKKGFFRVSLVLDQVTDMDIINDLNDARTFQTSDLVGLYLTVEDATHRKMDNFYINEDVSGRTVPIRGSVRCAYVNDCGYISQWSDPQELPEYQSCFISTHRAISIDRSNTSRPIIKPNYGGIIYTDESDGTYIQRNLTGAWSATPSSNFDYSAATSFTSSTTAIATSNATIMVDIANKTTKIYFDGASIDTSGMNLGSTGLDSFMEITDINFLHVETGAASYISSSDFATSALYTNIGDITTGIDYIPFSKNMPVTYDSSNSTSNNIVASTWTSLKTYGLTITNDEIYDENFFPFPEQLSITVNSTAVESFYGRIGRCGVKVFNDTAAGNYRLADAALKFDNILGDTNQGYPFTNIGNNHWEGINLPIALGGGSISSIDIQNKQIVLNPLGAFGIYDVVVESSCKTFMDNGGDRFAVYNDGKLLGVSQKAWRYETLQTTTYNVTASATNHSVPNADIQALYMPICSLEMQSVKPSYEVDENVEIMRNPKDIVINGSAVYILDGVELWLSDKSMLLKRKIDCDFTIYAIDKFQSGIVLSTSKGLYMMNNQGTYSLISGGENIKYKASTSGGGGVFIISKKDDVWFVRMVNNAGAVYPHAQKISDVINNVQWGPFPKMHYCDDTLWIAREYDVYGFYEGGWKRRYDMDLPIKKITDINDKLIINTENKFSLGAVTIDNLDVIAPGSFQDDMHVNTANDTAIFYTYTADTAGTFYYNTSTYTFDTAGAGTKYIRDTAIGYAPQGTGTTISAYIDTVDIFFDNNSVNSSSIEMFVKAVTSLANAKVNWASDTNLTFSLSDEPTVKLRSNGSTNETSSYANPVSAFGRTRKITIKEIKTQHRNAESIKFRLTADYTDGNDQFKILSLEVLPGAFIFEYGDN